MDSKMLTLLVTDELLQRGATDVAGARVVAEALVAAGAIEADAAGTGIAVAAGRRADVRRIAPILAVNGQSDTARLARAREKEQRLNEAKYGKPPPRDPKVAESAREELRKLDAAGRGVRLTEKAKVTRAAERERLWRVIRENEFPGGDAA